MLDHTHLEIPDVETSVKPAVQQQSIPTPTETVEVEEADSDSSNEESAEDSDSFDYDLEDAIPPFSMLEKQLQFLNYDS